MGPFLEKFQAIFEPSLLTCSFLHHVNASTGKKKKQTWNLLAKSKAKEISECMEGCVLLE